tara:strand:- start:134 stop:1180 length:1047 start_codon:yes stop_codon:yes gene_type:complete
MNYLKTYELTLKTVEIFKKCFEINGSPKKKENIIWQFLDNPENNSIVDIAYDEDKNRTASIYALFCVKLKIGNSLFKGAQSLDTMTDVNYRGRGLFVNRANDVYNKAKETNVSFVYGFPNGNSIHSFRKRLGWEVMDPVPFLIKPLKSKYFTNKISLLSFFPNINLSLFRFYKNKNYQIKEVNDFPKEIDTIWENFSKDITVAVNRDKVYLEWRYLQKPNESYSILHCYDASNKYLGCAIYTIKDKHNGKIGYIMELIYDLDKPKSGELLLKFAIDKIKKAKADCILVWCFEHSPNYKVFKKELFFKIPKKLKPIELHFGVRSFNEDIADFVNKRDNWYLSYSDSDTV